MEIEELVETYADYCYRVAFTYVKDHGAAEEIVQDVLLAHYQNEHTFEQRASLKTYLAKITVHKSLDYLRKKERKWGFFFTKGKNVEVADTTINLANTYAQKEKYGEVLDAVLQLDEKYRAIILFYYFEENTLAEISEILSIPLNTVKTRHQRAKQQLKQSLKEVYFDEEF
ncbi:MAG: RNA polymerase sigma factor [Kurthia gibsonii]